MSLCEIKRREDQNKILRKFVPCSSSGKVTDNNEVKSDDVNEYFLPLHPSYLTNIKDLVFPFHFQQRCYYKQSDLFSFNHSLMSFSFFTNLIFRFIVFIILSVNSLRNWFVLIVPANAFTFKRS